MKIIDALTHYGIKLYSYVKDLQLTDGEIEIEKIVLNPIYKYSCECCVDGFYQQYLWSKDKDFVIRLGIYNPKCRVPPQIELERQYEKEIYGIVLHPRHHGFSLIDERLSYIYEFANDHNLPIIIHEPEMNEVNKISNMYNLKIGIVSSKCDSSFYCISTSKNNKGIYGSGSPYNGKGLIESAKLYVSNYDIMFHYLNAKNFFNLKT